MGLKVNDKGEVNNKGKCKPEKKEVIYEKQKEASDKVNKLAKKIYNSAKIYNDPRMQ